MLFRERQWVPWHFWPMALGVVALTAATVGLNRPLLWTIIPFIVLSIFAAWILVSWSGRVITVTQDADGTRWLNVGDAQLPADIVSRSLVVPATASRNAMGPQLDPAAFVINHAWLHEMVMLVLDDEDDPTPYWLVTTRRPEELIQHFVPDQYEAATAHLR
ncbi:DUF3093 domain-containing protein [Corynebacterium incognita]|uniref:DUF3093 domain-containing protein n=1 Tax=Corynebacterium incognita TaxID=2754725 RepID=A0A7G7CS60_9CORY|nr:DUF3093 domain-containing protein [Corynebacterium incognita]